MSDDDRSRSEELWQRHERRARVYVRRRLGLTLRRRVNSDDVLQDVFLEVIRMFLAGKGPPARDASGEFRWLARMIDNRVLKLARFHVATGRRTVLREVPVDGAAPVLAPVEGVGKTPSNLLMELERTDSLEKAVQGLTSRERELIRLLYYERLTVQEAAIRLGKTRGSTAVLHCQAIKKLRGSLGRREERT